MSDTEYNFHDLKGMTVAQLREISSGIDHPAVAGYSQRRKDEVLSGICEALGIDMHEHHDVVGLNKAAVKAKIKDWKTQRDAALEAKDPAQLKMARTKMRRLRRKIRKSSV